MTKPSSLLPESTVLIIYPKKEPKSDASLSEFDWHDLSPVLFGHNAFL